MKICYFADTDYIARRASRGEGRRDARPRREYPFEVDKQGNICAITFEHASERAGIPEFSYEQIAPLLEAQNEK